MDLEVKKVKAFLFTLNKTHEDFWNSLRFANFQILEHSVLEESYSESVDFLFLDFSFICGFDFSAISKIKKIFCSKPLFVFSEEDSACLAVQCLKSGADDYFTFPLSVDCFLQKIKFFFHKEKKTNSECFTEFIGETEEMLEIKELAYKYSQSDLPIFILGESGTGKSFLAKLIHKHSKKAQTSFFEENMATVPEAIAEALLFGTKKGVFTGAENRIGLVEAATNGTLFLDEITEAPVAVQAKLLRVIAEKAYRPLGATEEKIANIRLITASNVNLQRALENKTLREDLYYRISPLTLKIPSLNERKDDIPLLIQYFVNKRKKDITYGAIDLLKKHHWKGNVRELESTLERAFCLCSNNTVTKEDIIFY